MPDSNKTDAPKAETEAAEAAPKAAKTETAEGAPKAAEAAPKAAKAKAPKGAKKDAAECDCRCVACARDSNCDNCVDHMVDCGDEDQCACMSQRNASPEAEIAGVVIDIDARLRNAGLTGIATEDAGA